MNNNEKMSSTYKSLAWESIIPHIIVFSIFYIFYWLIRFGDPFLFGLITYVVISYIVRPLVFERNFNAELKLVQDEKFEEAIPQFDKSIDFFRQYMA